MSSHPGSTMKDAIALAEYIRDLGYMPEQVQDFYPTPGTISTCMYYTGIDPMTMKPVYVAKDMEEKKTKKRHNATVTFSRKEQKEEMLQYLNSVQLQNIMPDDVKGKDCLKVLWAVEYLHRLAVDGKIRVQVPMFEEDSQEKQGLLDEIDALKADNKRLSELENGYVSSLNTLSEEITTLKERIADIRKNVEWTVRQAADTPDYADELIEQLFSVIGK